MLPDVRKAITHDDRLSLDRPGFQELRDNQRRYFRSLALITRDGRLAGGITSQTTQDYYARQPWWPVVFEQGRAWTGDIQVGPTGEGFWEVVVPIRHEDQSVIGALKVSVRTATLFDPALCLSIGETGNLMLVDETGSVLLCPVRPASRHTRIEGFTNRGNNADPNWVEVQEDGHGQTGGIIGMATVSLEGPIEQAKTWQMVVRQDPQETFAPVYSMMWKLGGFWLVTTILLTLIGSRVSSRLIHPLNTLIDYARILKRSAPRYAYSTGGGVWNNATGISITRNARSSIGGGKSNSVSEKLADACGGVIPASVANCDATAGVVKSIFREGRRSLRPLGFNAERSAIN